MAEKKLLETIQNFFRANKDYQPDFVESSAVMYKLSSIMLESAIDKTMTPKRPANQKGTRAKHNARQ